MKAASAWVAVFACLLSGCGASDWEEVERQGSGHALYLDGDSIQRNGSLATFWTRSSSTNWIKRATHGEMRTEIQIDCRRKYWRDIAGGFYVRGVQKYPFKKLSAGNIPDAGYMRSLYNRVC